VNLRFPSLTGRRARAGKRHPIELADVMRDLREELSTAITAAEDERLRLKLDQLVVEATVVADRSSDLQGKVRFWVVELGADKNHGSTSTLRINLSLTPKLAGTRQGVHISGDGEPGES
jgi:hypothetical protein